MNRDMNKDNKDMTNPELNRALAELMGFEVIGSERETGYFAVVFNGWTYGMWETTEEEAWKDAPDYCSDPAASLEVQTAAIEKDYKAYIHNLNTVIYGESEDDGEYSAVSVEVTAAMLTATSRERAEAAYITLGGE